MIRPNRSTALAAACAVASITASPALAGEVFAGAATHNLDIGIAVCCYERGADIQVGARTDPFARLLGGELRAHVLGSVNTAGGVDFGAVGLDLRYPLGDRFYIAPGLGGAAGVGVMADTRISFPRGGLSASASRATFALLVPKSERCSSRIPISRATSRMCFMVSSVFRI